MAAEWQSIELPSGSVPVHNKVGVFLLLTREDKEKYKLWKIYQRHDGEFWLYFGSGIKRKASDVLMGYTILKLVY